MPKAFAYSLFIHFLLISVLYFGIPSLFDKKLGHQEVITVELLDISDITNIKPQKPRPKPKPKKKPKITKSKPKKALPEPKLKPVKPVIKPKPKTKVEVKDIVPIEPKPSIKPKPKQQKQEPQKTEKPKKEEPKNSFASVLKSIEELEQNESEKPIDKKQDFKEIENLLLNNKEFEYKPDLPLTRNEKDAINQQIMKNWTVIAGAKNAQNTIVTIKIILGPDGSVLSHEVKNANSYNSDNFVRAMTDSAIRAIYKSNPLKNLPQDKYNTKGGWREIELNFDPEEMFY